MNYPMDGCMKLLFSYGLLNANMYDIFIHILA